MVAALRRGWRDGTRAAAPLLLLLPAATDSCAKNRDSCAAASAREAWPEAQRLCADEYRRAPTPRAALDLCRATLKAGGAPDLCDKVIGALAEGPWAAEADQLLGHAAMRKNAPGRARQHFERALAWHERAADWAGLARDAQGLAGVAKLEGEYGEAVRWLDKAIEAADRSGNHRLRSHMQIVRGDVLRAGGDYDEAQRAFGAALRLASTPQDRAWLLFKHGLLHLVSGSHVLAEQTLREALTLAVQSGDHDLASACRLNLGWLARQAGDLDRADEAFASAAGASAASADAPVAIPYNRGLIEAERGDRDRPGDPARAAAHWERAAAYLAEAERAGPSGAWALFVPYEAGKVFERLGRRDQAKAAYQRSIAAVERLRDRAGTLAAHVVAAHRLPHERLIGLFAREGDWRGVLAVVLSLDLSMVLATEAPSPELSPDGSPIRPAGVRAQALPARWPAGDWAGEGASGPADVARALEAWRGRQLVVLAPGGDRADAADGRMWRLEVVDGEVRGVDAGPIDCLERLASRLEAHLDDREAARALGQALVPASFAGGTVDLLLLGPVARAPLGALRRGDALVSATTPLARVLGLRAWAGRGGDRPARGAVVLGDPLGNLPAAAQEAALVAARLGTDARLGPSADRGALASAEGAALLHLASHAADGIDGPALRLSGGDLRAQDIFELRPTARLVVLSSCASATSRDGSGWGSLAAAFLGAGAEAVVATQWSVNDASTARVIEALYDDAPARDVFRDPAAALAAAQAQVAGRVPASTWAAFTVVRAPPRVSAEAGGGGGR
ncbi:MAG TPA: CHAT domain-containing protein [Polyangiaceae bacterium]|nr:CHAT domain-containing protein [Polyangiaceae bacterium]